VHQGRILLTGNHNTCMVHADVRHPDQVLDAAELRELLELDKPIAVLLIDLLHHIPDTDNPSALLAAYTTAVCSGSYLALTQLGEDEQLRTGFTTFSQMFGTPAPTLAFRDPEWITHSLSGLDLIKPGVVPVPLWRPNPEHDNDRNPEMYRAYAALAHKP
jgi:hypothetical protein